MRATITLKTHLARIEGDGGILGQPAVQYLEGEGPQLWREGAKGGERTLLTAAVVKEEEFGLRREEVGGRREEGGGGGCRDGMERRGGSVKQLIHVSGTWRCRDGMERRGKSGGWNGGRGV